MSFKTLSVVQLYCNWAVLTTWRSNQQNLRINVFYGVIQWYLLYIFHVATDATYIIKHVYATWGTCYFVFRITWLGWLEPVMIRTSLSIHFNAKRVPIVITSLCSLKHSKNNLCLVKTLRAFTVNLKVSTSRVTLEFACWFAKELVTVLIGSRF